MNISIRKKILESGSCWYERKKMGEKTKNGGKKQKRVEKNKKWGEKQKMGGKNKKRAEKNKKWGEKTKRGGEKCEERFIFFLILQSKTYLVKN